MKTRDGGLCSLGEDLWSPNALVVDIIVIVSDVVIGVVVMVMMRALVALNQNNLHNEKLVEFFFVCRKNHLPCYEF